MNQPRVAIGFLYFKFNHRQVKLSPEENVTVLFNNTTLLEMD